MSYTLPESDLAAKDITAYLRKHEEKDMLRFLTAGSVDDGKSTLIGRLLFDSRQIYEDQLAAAISDSKIYGHTDEEFDPALLTDGLKAEREQGITIDVAYRYFSTDKRSFIICDCPGHEQYTRNMATGASHCSLAVILVDARHGVMPQTKRHSFIARLLGIQHLVVAINKMDAVGYDEAVYDKIRHDYMGFATRLESCDIHFIPISALKGDNVVQRSENMPWFDGGPLLSFLERVEVAADRNLIDFRFPVQYVQRPNLDFRGFSGTIVSGHIRKGDEVVAMPSGRRTRVKDILTFSGSQELAFAPMAVTITTEDEVDISRGDVLARPNNVPTVSSRIDASLVWMAEKPMRQGANYLLKCRTNTVPVTINELRYRWDINELTRLHESEELEMNEIGRVNITTHRALCFDPYNKNRHSGSFILIDTITNNTVAAGMILEQKTSESQPTTDPKQEPKSANIRRESSKVTAETRLEVFGHAPATLWLTGLSGSGKSTIAQILEHQLLEQGKKACILDGDNIRHGLCRDLAFSPEDRSENIRRIAEVAKLMNDAGLIVITAFISPFRVDRQQARDIVGEERFQEIHINTPLEVCEQRDVKGLYKKARAGQIKEFTGITSAYEPPENAALTINTQNATPEAAASKILDMLG